MASAAFRQGAFARWVGWTSLVLGGITTLFLVSPAAVHGGHDRTDLARHRLRRAPALGPPRLRWRRSCTTWWGPRPTSRRTSPRDDPRCSAGRAPSPAIRTARRTCSRTPWSGSSPAGRACANRAAADAYVRRTITRQYVSWQRQPWRRDEVASDDLPETGPDVGPRPPADPSGRLWDLVLALPPQQRAAVALRYYEQLSVAETAAVLGCSTGTVKSNTSRGIAALRRLAAGTGPMTTR